MHALRRRALFCPSCGALPRAGGFCFSCYWQHRRSLRYFAGLREAVLRREGCRCQACGAANQRAVHHRRPGLQALPWLVTLCPACHAVVHRLRARRRFLPDPLLRLWREQQPAAPLQLQLAMDVPPAQERAA